MSVCLSVCPHKFVTPLYLQSCNGRLQIYQCDISVVFKLAKIPSYIKMYNTASLHRDIIGMFDCVWDKGAFGAISPHRRQRYVDMISSILTSEGRMILETAQHEETGDFHGPPYSIEEQLISDLFCTLSFDFKLLRRQANDDILQKFHSVGLTKYENVAFLLWKRSS